MINKTRDTSIDIAKAIGIILVVLGHTEFFMKDFVYQFHLPLFFFLSGFVFNLSKIKSPKEFFIKKIKSLYIPFITFEIIFLIFHNLFVNIGFYNELSNFNLTYSFRDYIINFLKILTMGYGEQLAGPLWFLIATLEINIIFAILAKASDKIEKKFPILLLMISIILFFVGCYTNLPRMLSQSLIGMFFYCCGYIYKRYEDKIKFKYPFFIISIAVLILCTVFNTVDISQLDITFKTLLIVSGLAGVYSVLFISKKFNFLKNKFILYCGKNTIYILALHCLVFKILMYIEIKLYDGSLELLGLFPIYQKTQLWGLIFTVFGVIIPIAIKKVIDVIVQRTNELKEKKQCIQNQ